MKRISLIIFVVAIVFLLSSCNKNEMISSNNTADMNTKSNNIKQTEYKLEEYYETSEFEKYGYEWIDAINYCGNDLLISGSKSIKSNKRCLIVSDKSDEYKTINLNIDYSSVKDSCIVGETMFVLHDDKVSSVNINTGEIEYEKVISNVVSVIQSNGDNFILKDFAGDTLFLYDKNFDFIKKIDIKKLLNINSEIHNIRLLGTKERIYLAGDIDGIITLYVLNSNYKVIFSNEYPDLPGMAYQIYDDGTNIILISNDSNTDPDTHEYTICSYIDVLDYNNGTLKQMYEVPDAQFVFWNYYNSDIISKNSKKINIWNLGTNYKSDFDLPENYIVQRVTQSSDKIMFFEDCEDEISSCITHVSIDGAISEYRLDSNMNNIQFTKHGDIIYSLTDENTKITKVIINDSEFKTVKEIQLESSTINQISESIKIEYCDNKFYAIVYDIDNNLWTTVYDLDGKILNEYILDFSIVYKLLNSGDSIYAVYDKYIDGCGISEITNTDAIPLRYFHDLDINNCYSGDEQYDLYYTIGSVIYGYEQETETSSRIINYYDSGISNIESMFTKIADNKYLCDTNENNNIKYIQLLEADDETLKRLNERKIIVAAGDTVYWGDTVSKAIVNFNHVNKDYYIVTQDYSKTFDSGIDQFKIDIIKGKIPDLFISGGSLDTKLMENNNAFENLSEYIKNSKISFEDFYPKDIDNSEIFYISPVIGFGVIENNSILSEFEGGISTADFLEKSKKYNLKFSNCTISQLFDYLVVDNLDDYVDYTNKKCYFKTDTFVDLMEYIKNAESSNGELKLAIYNNFYELMNFSSEKSYFDISDKGLFTAHINENIKMSIYINSEYKDVIWGFIESVFDSGEQILNYGLPVSKDINGLNYYNSYAISNKKLFSLLSRGRLVNISDKNIHNILYNELDSFINGKITASEYAENVQNQIMLYLSEL